MTEVSLAVSRKFVTTVSSRRKLARAASRNLVTDTWEFKVDKMGSISPGKQQAR